MPELSIMLVAHANDPRDDGPRHVALEVTQAFALYLANLHDAYKELARKVDGLFCFEVWNGTPNWGRIRGFEPEETGKWYVSGNGDAAFVEEESVELETVKVMDDGVMFSAALKNDESGVYSESPILSWTDVERMAKAATFTEMHRGMPVAEVGEDDEELSEGDDDGEDDEDEE